MMGYLPPERDPEYTEEGLLALRPVADSASATRLQWVLWRSAEGVVYVPVGSACEAALVQRIAQALCCEAPCVVDELPEGANLSKGLDHGIYARYWQYHVRGFCAGDSSGIRDIHHKWLNDVGVGTTPLTSPPGAVQTVEGPGSRGAEIPGGAQNLARVHDELIIDVATPDPGELLLPTAAERQELEALRREVQLLRNSQADLAMGASIKLATTRMVLSTLLKDSRLLPREREALRGALDMLPAPSTGHIEEANRLARAAQVKQLGLARRY